MSPGCANCYARTWARFTKAKLNLWPERGEPSPEHGIMVTSDANWREPLKWARTLPEQLGRRPRIFCASMADVFEELPQLAEHRVRLMMLIEHTPELDWLVLTKRPEYARDWLTRWYDAVDRGNFAPGDRADRPYRNMWLGTSIENSRFTWRADVLREIPAAVRFISAEPLLGSLFKLAPSGSRSDLDNRSDRVALAGAHEDETDPDRELTVRVRKPLDLSGIDWVIAGGESGAKARPSHPDWFREIRDGCLAATVCPHGLDLTAACYCQQCEASGDEHERPRFFFKQWGQWGSRDDSPATSKTGRWIYPDGSTSTGILSTGAPGAAAMFPLGKNISGRHLDGRVWDEFPQSVAVPA